MKLVEEGKLSLDDPIGKHLKSFEGRRITIRDLLHHSSGLPAYLTPKAGTTDGILEEIAALRPVRGYTYSCLNMLSAARIVEHVTKMPLAEYVRINLFEPLGMKDTSFSPPASRCAPTGSSRRGPTSRSSARRSSRGAS
jgi:CubicO group peptidase (beta-lactamase class C family)